MRLSDCITGWPPPRASALYAKRKISVEPVFGVMKHVMRFRQFLLRGVEGARGEWNILSMAFNLKRMHVLAQAG